VDAAGGREIVAGLAALHIDPSFHEVKAILRESNLKSPVGGANSETFEVTGLFPLIILSTCNIT
jgi:hypothetical protein